MTQTEALRLALEALESGEKMQANRLVWIEYDSSLVKQAITAIKTALEAKDEPHGWKLVPIEPTDEMLKAMDECSTEGYDERLYAGYAASVYMAAVDVAPTPPQRTWVGLTEDEIVLISADCAATHQHTDIHFAKAIEQALKDRNT
jgi:hypothetical protein